LEPKKQKVSYGHLGVGRLALIETDDDMATFEDFFGVLQKSDKGFLGAAVIHLRHVNQNVETTFPDKSIPSVLIVLLGSRDRAWQTTSYAKTEPQCRCLGVQSLARKVRGIP